MDICDAKQLPEIGGVYAVPNDVTWEPERLTCVFIEEQPELASMMEVEHVYFVYLANNMQER